MTQTSPAAASTASRAARETESRAGEMAAAGTPLIEVKGLRKTYQTARRALTLFDNLIHYQVDGAQNRCVENL